MRINASATLTQIQHSVRKLRFKGRKKYLAFGLSASVGPHGEPLQNEGDEFLKGHYRIRVTQIWPGPVHG